jgi:hypothetical protein
MIDDLIFSYAHALSDYGLEYSAQMRLFQCAGIKSTQHVKAGKSYLDDIF